MKTRNIIFKAGYYEWNVFIDDEFVYSFGDFSDYIDEEDTVKQLTYVVNESIDCMLEDFAEKGKGGVFTNNELTELKKQMIERLGYHYGVDISVYKMTKDEIISQLNELSVYATDHIVISDCDDIWFKDTIALTEAVEMIDMSIKMLIDIFDNLGGQDMFSEMLTILHKDYGHTLDEFERLGICSTEAAKLYIKEEI